MQLKKILIAPSILAANQAMLAQEARRVEKAGADLLHVDVMDGRFVPRINYDVGTVRRLRKATELPLDVHLMINEPWKVVAAYAKAGAKRICVHAEACDEKQLLETIGLIKNGGCEAGIALVPATPLAQVPAKALAACDFLMPMTVVPGASGQAFLYGVLPKFSEANKIFRGKKEIETDGGINAETVRAVVREGASVIVAGAAVFNSPDAKAAIKQLRESAKAAAKK